MDLETATLIESFREELRAIASPWRTRKGAAAHLGCDEAFIDMMVTVGDLPRHYLYGTPRFRVKDLDALVRNKKVPFERVKEAFEAKRKVAA